MPAHRGDVITLQTDGTLMGWREMLCKTPGEGLVLQGRQQRSESTGVFHCPCRVEPHWELGAAHCPRGGQGLDHASRHGMS